MHGGFTACPYGAEIKLLNGLCFPGRGKRRVLFAAVAVCVFATCSSPAAGAQHIGPASIPTTATLVYDKDFPDPSILVVGRTYFAFSTNSDGEDVPEIESHDLVHWHAIGDVMSVLPFWASRRLCLVPIGEPGARGGYELFFQCVRRG